MTRIFGAGANTNEADAAPEIHPSLDLSFDLKEPEAPPVSAPEEKKKAKRRRKQSKIELIAELEAERRRRRRVERKLSKLNTAPDSLVETWFHLAARNLETQLRMVDSGAKTTLLVLGSVAGIGLLSSQWWWDPTPESLAPPLLLLISMLVAAGLVARSMRPSPRNGTFSWEDVASRKAKLMTFGDFYRMGLEDYEQAIDAMMTNREFLYGTIKRELHASGVELARRRALLQRAHRAFVFGLGVSLAIYLAPRLAPTGQPVRAAPEEAPSGISSLK
ncbi:MAG: Pycsar system effector family protein [Myxococcota bacterium]